ncbi:MAG: hypothetical protein GXP29_00680 [Planctomycetes bacterium]|nr:hypothetical protein [Planctomycetota bacterium]
MSNLFGALTNPLAFQRLTFERFFSHPKAQGKIQLSAAPATPEIFALVNDVFVRRAVTDEIAEHGAYWVNMSQAFVYRGPIDVASDREGLNFGRSAPTRTITVEVPVSAQEEFLAIRAIPCAQIGGIPTCTGGDLSWLQFRDPTLPPSKASWSPLAFGAFLAIPPGTSSVSLEIRAQRDALATAAATGTVAGEVVGGVSLDAVIEISSDNGSRVLIPTGVEVQPIFGQWIGRATLTKVSTHPALQDLPLEQASAVPLGVTLILDLPDPALPAGATGFRLLDSVEFPSHRDGESFMRRVHAVLFDRPVVLTEDSGAPLDPFGTSGTLTGVILTSAEDPLNPYRHRYNPEHRVGYDITRSITLQIQPQGDSVIDELSGLDGTFGPNKLTGVYTEIITGVSRDPITVTGSFRLQRLTQPATVSIQGP